MRYAVSRTEKGSHFLVWERLMRHPKRAFNAAGSYGDDLRRKRTEADYERNVSVGSSDATTAIGLAERVFKALGRSVP